MKQLKNKQKTITTQKTYVSWCESRVTPWTVYQFRTGLNRQSFALTYKPTASLEFRIPPMGVHGLWEEAGEPQENQ